MEIDKGATDLLMQFVNNVPSIGLPTRDSTQMPGGTYRSDVVLDPGTTSAIVSASKKRGLTVTTALHAALIVALQQLTPVPLSNSTKYTTCGAFNVRPFLKAPFNDSTLHPDTVHAALLPLTLHTSTYANLAAQLTQFYKQRLPPSADSHIHEGIMVPFTNRLADMLGQPPPVDLPAPSDPILSSVGIVDAYLKREYGDIEVKDFWVGVEMVTPQITCHLWTWQGKMTLGACYNETFYDQGFVQDFLQRVIGIVFTELAIQE